MQAKDKHIHALLERCKKNERAAQFEIYSLYYKAMYNTALRILKNRFDAEDVMQESFLVAFSKPDSFTNKTSFGAWLKKIVIHKSLTQLKRNNRFEEIKADFITNDKNATSDADDTTDYTLLKAKEITDAIGQLKDRYRIVLTLNLIEGYDYEEIAAILKITCQNSRTLISRAKRKLRQLVSEHYGK